ncbi:MAG TPA: dienelactone hydrolase family protein [Ohtaekwangia sp.]|uniref:dienelactone hydrolase family protein n=1 Tax=Ohtaekwangia sp. TaxID=2066019 RepID=UPI002F92CF0D
MKKIYLSITFILFAAALFAQQQEITVCHTSATEKFAVFASSKEFKASHATPGKYVHVSEEGGKMIKFKCADGVEANGYLIESKTKTNNWILVFQEWWGLNDYIKKQSDNLYKDLGNVNILAVDMYDGKVTNQREDAARYMQEFKQERGNAIVKGALEYAGKNARVGTIGWCFGGGQSLLAALTAGKQAAACVIYYGMPVEDVARLKELNCEVLGIFATQDKWINPETVAKFESNMSAAGKKLTLKSYNADHGFANPSNAMGYKEEATKDAYENTLAFFKSKLK